MSLKHLAHESAASVGSNLHIFVDGASRGNPGIAGAGALIRDAHGRVVKRVKKKLGIATNNVAEYSALVMALEEALSMGAKAVIVHADSELMVRQINGLYSVKSESLRPLYESAKAAIAGFDRFKIRHIPRHDNKEADKLANDAIDGVI